MQYNFITHQEIKKTVHALVNNSINKNSSSSSSSSSSRCGRSSSKKYVAVCF